MLVGLLGAVALGPSIVFAPIGGALADRFCPRKLLISFSYLEIAGPLLMAVAAATGSSVTPTMTSVHSSTCMRVAASP